VRLKELDSLRGLAALAVSFYHGQTLFASGAAAAVLALLAMTPLHAMFDGGRAVVFFFVLSGFVLAVPFFRGPVSPVGFVLKRMARIYPAYWAVLIIAILVQVFTGGPAIGAPCTMGFGDLALLKTCVDPAPPWHAVAFLIALFSEYQGYFLYDPVMWSLVQELRLSILFPLIMLPVVRFPSRWVLLASLPLVVAGFFANSVSDGNPLPLSGPYATIYYAWFFVLGAVAAKHIEQLAGLVRGFTARRAALWLAVTLIVFGSLPVIGFASPVEEAAVGLSTVSLMVLGLAWSGLSRLLVSSSLRVLGRMAYSYYLVHYVALELAARLLFGRIPSLALFVLGIAVALIMAWASYRWIEVPSIRLGHALYGRFRKSPSTRATQESPT